MAKTEKSIWSKVGVWSYIGGIALAVIFGLVTLATGDATLPAWAVVVLALLGILVGLLNIGDEEVQMFLIASVAFVIASASLGSVFNALGSGWTFLAVIMSAITVFTAPGALVVAFKALYNVAKDE